MAGASEDLQTYHQLETNNIQIISVLIASNYEWLEYLRSNSSTIMNNFMPVYSYHTVKFLRSRLRNLPPFDF
jgi:ubiquitin C-terminal hydrolase